MTKVLIITAAALAFGLGAADNLQQNLGELQQARHATILTLGETL